MFFEMSRRMHDGVSGLPSALPHASHFRGMRENKYSCFNRWRAEKEAISVTHRSPDWFMQRTSLSRLPNELFDATSRKCMRGEGMSHLGHTAALTMRSPARVRDA